MKACFAAADNKGDKAPQRLFGPAEVGAQTPERSPIDRHTRRVRSIIVPAPRAREAKVAAKRWTAMPLMRPYAVARPPRFQANVAAGPSPVALLQRSQRDKARHALGAKPRGVLSTSRRAPSARPVLYSALGPQIVSGEWPPGERETGFSGQSHLRC